MVARDDRSLLPGAPTLGADRDPKGVFAIDMSVSRAFSLNPQILVDVTDPDLCPVAVLPFLAWAYSVDAWPPGATEAEKRTMIKRSIAVHRRKGTIQSIKDVLAAAGYGDAVIQTGFQLWRLDGSVPLDGTRTLSSLDGWAAWSIVIDNGDPLPSAELVALLVQTAPARCILISIGYLNAFNRLDGTWRLDGGRQLTRTYEEV